jgi:hypothetical protein
MTLSWLRRVERRERVWGKSRRRRPTGGRAPKLDPEDIGALYSTAFLLEHECRLAASAVARPEIIDWNDTRGLTLESVWSNQELA